MVAPISPRPMLFISGDQAHSKEFSEQACRLAGQPKELVWVKGAGQVDLYDRTDLIPFERPASFFRHNLPAPWPPHAFRRFRLPAVDDRARIGRAASFVPMEPQ